MFSQRIPWSLETNEYAKLLASKRAAGVRILDLTESNPTRAGFHYPPAILEALADPRALLYEPSAAGLDSARSAVADLHGVSKDRILLTASTSESYSYLFKLLCNPGDRVLTPRPSYPLFEILATLESVDVAQYSLRFDGQWRIDFDSILALLTSRTRAILLVNPNNPTGSYVQPDEVARLAELCANHELALISDEVFHSPQGADWSAVEVQSLVFRLHGLSKMAGLPQMKAGWMIVGGPETLRREAMDRLELIADSFLSVSTPVQHALPELLRLGEDVRAQISQRTAANLEWLQGVARPLPVEAGWYAILPLPESVDEHDFVLMLLDEYNVLVQPGFFYDFERGEHVVISLLANEDDFREGVRRMLGEASP